VAVRTAQPAVDRAAAKRVRPRPAATPPPASAVRAPRPPAPPVPAAGTSTTPPTPVAPAETQVISRSPAPSPAWPPPLAGPTLAREAVVPAAPSAQTYDQLSEQLRRDLLRQRERSGDILGDLPWA
jgi:hypothetical protein